MHEFWLTSIIVTLSIAVVMATPQSSVRVKFVSLPQTYAHAVDISVTGQQSARQMAVSQTTLAATKAPLEANVSSYVRQRPGRTRLPHTFVSVVPVTENPEAMWPNGVFLPPDNHLSHLGLALPDENHGLYSDLEEEAEPDQYLLTGAEASAVVKFIFSHGELFYSSFPHPEALLRHQTERQTNGLAGNRLGSNRPESPFYRWVRRQQTRGRSTPSTAY